MKEDNNAVINEITALMEEFGFNCDLMPDGTITRIIIDLEDRGISFED